MNRNELDRMQREAMRRDLPPFRPGDTVRVHVRVREGEKDRTQVFEGVVLRRRRGANSATFTVRKVSYGVGVERIFPLESPVVEKVEIKSRGHVRRSRLYYLRGLRGKAARLRAKLRDVSALVEPEESEAPEPEPTQDEAAEVTEVVPDIEGAAAEAAGGEATPSERSEG